jgi:hypothetical protein
LREATARAFISAKPNDPAVTQHRHSIAISGDGWADDVRLSDIEDRFICKVCGKRGADVRPDFSIGNKKPVDVTGYRS